MASALPFEKPNFKSLKDPAPPHAITGTGKFLEIFEIISKSYPNIVPSLLIELINISPAPKLTALLAQFKASNFVFFNPHCE